MCHVFHTLNQKQKSYKGELRAKNVVQTVRNNENRLQSRDMDCNKPVLHTEGIGFEISEHLMKHELHYWKCRMFLDSESQDISASAASIFTILFKICLSRVPQLYGSIILYCLRDPFNPENNAVLFSVDAYMPVQMQKNNNNSGT